MSTTTKNAIPVAPSVTLPTATAMLLATLLLVPTTMETAVSGHLHLALLTPQYRHLVAHLLTPLIAPDYYDDEDSNSADPDEDEGVSGQTLDSAADHLGARVLWWLVPLALCFF